MAGEHWLHFRLATYLFAFAVSVATPFFVPQELLQSIESLPPWMLVAIFIGLLLLLAAFPLMCLFVVGIQAINPWSDRVWSRPTLRSRPFNTGNPLLAIHDASFVVAAGGVGLLVSSPWNGLIFAAAGMLQLFGGAMLRISLRLCLHVFRSKLEARA